MSALDRWYRAVRHARTVERQWARLDESVRVRDSAIAYPVGEFVSPERVVAVCEAVQSEAYFYVMACGRMAASVKEALDLFPRILDESDFDMILPLRNFWEHEDDYPLLGPPHPTRKRQPTLEFLAEYGLSPALRSLVHRSRETQSILISDRLDADHWRAKAQAISESELPTSGTSTHAGA